MTAPSSPGWLPLLPTAHYMAFAPLDVWCRLLFCPWAKIPPRYWLRLVGYLIASTIATVFTLPERIVLGVWFKLFPPQRANLPGPIFVLGYYRSGTTHLQYLLNCDPQFYTPRWYHMLVPTGFVFTWTLFRLFMIPFMSGKRPMDGVGVGPEYPAEDQFGVNNWCLACPLIGKSVLPQLHAHYNRFHTLQGLSNSELARWRAYQFDLVRKLALVAGPRQILLKSPSHTAHVEELLDLFRDMPGVKFIHITRHPHKVLQSNVWMHQVFQTIWNLQDGQPDEVLEDQLVDDYVETEQRYLAARSKIPAGQLAEIRIQDLHADPLGQLKRVYAELNLPFTPAFEAKLLSHLHANSDYQPNTHAPWTADQQQRLMPRLDPLIDQFRHREPSVPKVPLPPAEVVSPAALRWQTASALAWATVTGVICGLVWLGLSRLVAVEYAQEFNRLIWPTGIVIGYAALRMAPRGSTLLGLVAAGLTLLVLLGVNFCLGTWELPTVTLPALGTVLAQNLFNLHTVFWTTVAMLSAYFLASRPQTT